MWATRREHPTVQHMHEYGFETKDRHVHQCVWHSTQAQGSAKAKKEDSHPTMYLEVKQTPGGEGGRVEPGPQTVRERGREHRVNFLNDAPLSERPGAGSNDMQMMAAFVLSERRGRQERDEAEADATRVNTR